MAPVEGGVDLGGDVPLVSLLLLPPVKPKGVCLRHREGGRQRGESAVGRQGNVPS